jgi:hypothetical protein
MPKVKRLLNRIVTFFKTLKDAEQLSSEQRGYRILSKALEKYLNGRLLQPPIGLPHSNPDTTRGGHYLQMREYLLQFTWIFFNKL